MRAEVTAHLRCPVCAASLRLDGPRGPLACGRGHSFDQARQGYAQLTAGPLAHTGDRTDMVAARSAFLSGGHFAAITAGLADTAARTWSGGLVVDIGAGTGSHLAGVLDRLPGAYGLAVDASKAAARAAARAHPRADAIVCDVWQPLPIADGAAGVVLDVFAPRSGPEFARILAPGGVLLVVTPAADHLTELVSGLGLLRVDPDKADRVAASLGDAFTTVTTDEIRATMRLSAADVITLAGMGPSAWHLDPADLRARLAALPSLPMAVTLAVTLAVYRLTDAA